MTARRPLIASIALLALASLAGVAHAQAAINPGTLTILASPTSCKSGCVPTITWSTTPDANGSPASSCTASGGWTGSEPTSGSFTPAALTATTSYTLTCTWTDSTITFSWTASTTNTNGSTITLTPLSYSLYSGATATAVTTLVKSGITGLTYQLTGQGATSLFYGVTATDSSGDVSALSNTLQGITGSATVTASETVTITPTPNAPGNFTVVVSH